jgi:CubicO group peptidase (beta-lactamase class C family)
MNRDGANSTNWIDAPFNRWGFLHVRELTRTARIGRSPRPVDPLPRRSSELETFTFAHGDRRWTLPEMLDATFTDGLMVVHDGAVLLEQYGGVMRPSDTHLLMSVSKSLTSTLAGVLIGRGVISPGAVVTDYIHGLRGSSWEGCTVQHLLDMRAGTRFDEEDYDDPDSDGRLIEQVSGYTAPLRHDLPGDTYQLIAEATNAEPHGGPFRYRSILPDALAWVMCEATGQSFPELFSQHIWSKFAADDADIIVDAAGFPVVEGGICSTLEDLARFGVMCLQDGRFGDQQIVPAEWMRRPQTRDQELIDAFSISRESSRAGPHACYRDFWWVYDSAAGIYCGLGINGQVLMIHHPSNTVVAKLSTWPDRMDYRLGDLTDAGLLALCDAL